VFHLRTLFIGVVALGAVLAAAYVLSETGGARGQQQAVQPAAAVPLVTVATVERDAASSFLRGIGTVEPIRSVAVGSRVDGELMRVAFTEGDDVHAGDLLFEIDPRPFKASLAQAQAQLTQNEAELQNAKLDLARYDELLKKGNVSRQTYDTQRARVRQLEAAIEADHAAVDAAKLNLEFTQIRAPISGRTGSVALKEGNLIRTAQNQVLVTITQIEPINLTFSLPQEQLPRIRARDAEAVERLPVVALSADNTTRIETGHLVFIDNRVDPATGTIQLKAQFKNAERKLWPGQFANAQLEIERRENGVLADARAVQTGPNGYFAYVLRNDETVEVRSLQVAQIEAGRALIDAGLTPGERVVVEGQLKLKPGARVRITAPQVSQAPVAP
jgi:membrane fusion protein, multidrug efflux system